MSDVSCVMCCATNLRKEVDVAHGGSEQNDGHVGGVEQLNGLRIVLSSCALEREVRLLK